MTRLQIRPHDPKWLINSQESKYPILSLDGNLNLRSKVYNNQEHMEDYKSTKRASTDRLLCSSKIHLAVSIRSKTAWFLPLNSEISILEILRNQSYKKPSDKIAMRTRLLRWWCVLVHAWRRDLNIHPPHTITTPNECLKLFLCYILDLSSRESFLGPGIIWADLMYSYWVKLFVWRCRLLSNCIIQLCWSRHATMLSTTG